MLVVLVNQVPARRARAGVHGVVNRIDGVVAGGRDEERVSLRIQGQAGGADDQGVGIGAEGIARGDARLGQHLDIVAAIGHEKIDARHRAIEHVGNEDLGMVALLMNRQIPRAVEQVRIGEGFHELAVAIQDEQGAGAVNVGPVGRRDVAD